MNSLHHHISKRKKKLKRYLPENERKISAVAAKC
jgi:hypothetical protein